ncbi:Cathepsin L2, partial [Stylophora pistillata]
MTEEEIRQKKGLLRDGEPDVLNGGKRFEIPEGTNVKTLPDTVDCAKSGAVDPVTSEGICGSCYAYSVTGAMEGACFIKEYLAALYLAHKLLSQKVNVFRDLNLEFYEVTSKYNQVFLFVSGMLGEDANTLFDHIGENLQMTHWDWPNCTGQVADFFIECFSENRNAEQMAVTLCSYVPFPQSIFIDMKRDSLRAFLSVAEACKSFTQLRLPVHLTVFHSDAQALTPFRDYPVIGGWGFRDGDDCDKFLASYSRLETIVVSNFVTPAVCSALQVNLSLHSFTFERDSPFSSEEAVAIGDSLAANKALQTMTLKLLGQLGENWTTVLEKGLSGERPLTSVVLEISGSVRESEKKPLKKLLLKRSLKSLSLAIYGDMHDSLATSIGEGLATNPFLQSLTLIVYGSVSCSAFTSLKMGVLRNSALKSLEVKVFGGLPDNWHNIVRCLLRRYCTKNKVKAAVDDKDLEEQFEDSLLALGQLAWRCLQKDRVSFLEEELAEFENAMKTLAARKLGLIFKEASSRKINPQHEYHFFHKTFQEYLAALYLAHKLLKEKVNVFRDLKLSLRAEVMDKYHQVFLFVSGVLGKKAGILFGQIGEELKTKFWKWPDCFIQQATFFIESGNGEQVAMTLCSYVPFPQSITIKNKREQLQSFFLVVNACKSFSQLQLPVHLTVLNMKGAFRVGTNALLAVLEALQVNPSLRSFTLERICPFSSKQAEAIAENLPANKTLETVAMKLIRRLGEDRATVLVKELSKDTPQTSTVQEINGSVKKSEIVALKKDFFIRSPKSLNLTIYGAMHDLLATLVGGGLVADPCLRSLSLMVYGNVRYSAFTSLKRAVLENSALGSLELNVFGGLPYNWLNICEAFYAAKTSSMYLEIEPDVVSRIQSAQLACLCPVLEENCGFMKLHSLTLNMWGELSCLGADDVCKLLTVSGVSCVNLNIHGRVTESVATRLVENLDKVNSLSDLSINVQGEV